MDLKVAVSKKPNFIVENFREEIEQFNKMFNFKDFFPNLNSQEILKIEDINNNKKLVTQSQPTTRTMSTISNSFVSNKKQKLTNVSCSTNINSNDIGSQKSGTKVSNVNKPIESSSNLSLKTGPRFDYNEFNQVEQLNKDLCCKYQFDLNDLPKRFIQLDDESGFKFEISSAISPYELYVYALFDNHQDYYEMEENINDFYHLHEDYLEQFSKNKKYDFVFLDALCVARSPKTKIFYRAQIKYLKNSYAQDSRGQDTLNLGLIQVIYIDYGIYDCLNYSNLYPIIDKFCALPPYIISCRLDAIKPTSSALIWSDKEIEWFNKSLKKYKSFKARIRDHLPNSLLECDLNKNIRVCFQNAYKSENDDLPGEEIFYYGLNDMMVTRGFALFDIYEQKEDLDLLESASNIRNNEFNKRAINNKSNIGGMNLPVDDFEFKKSELINTFWIVFLIQVGS